METKPEIRESLTSRRVRITRDCTPAAVAVFPACRQEVAVLAGVSVPQYPEALQPLGSCAATVDAAESSRARAANAER